METLLSLMPYFVAILGMFVTAGYFDRRMRKALQRQAEENAEKITAEIEKLEAERKKIEAETGTLHLGAAQKSGEIVTQLFAEIDKLRNKQRQLEHLVGQAQAEAQVSINSFENYKKDTDKKIVALQQENHRLREENRQLREEFDLYKKNSAAELASAYHRNEELERENERLKTSKPALTLRQQTARATDD